MITAERQHEITHRARCDADALRCGYPKRAIPYAGDELKLYEAEYEKARQAHKVYRK